MSAHARLSASAAHRWLHCPASLGESSTSEYAATGTFAHWIAADCLETGEDPKQWLGNTTVVDGFTVTCDQEMVDAVNLYIDEIAKDLQPGDKRWIEMPLLDALQKVDPEMGGTADYVRYRPSTKHLRVMDFKYGAGTYVEVDDNAQAKVYGLGVMLAIDLPVTDVELTIVQPRFEGAAPVRNWSFKAADILDFAADCQDAAAKTRLPNPVPVPGPQCKAFCPHRSTCPELERMQNALTASDFTANITTFDPAKLASALAMVPLVKERIKAIEELAYTKATSGVELPGFKLVDKVARRQWKSPDGLKEWALLNGYDPYAAPELLSPAQIEAKIAANTPKGQKGKAGEAIAHLVEKVSSGTVLVPVTDNRPEAKRITAADFTADIAA